MTETIFERLDRKIRISKERAEAEKKKNPPQHTVQSFEEGRHMIGGHVIGARTPLAPPILGGPRYGTDKDSDIGWCIQATEIMGRIAHEKQQIGLMQRGVK